MTNITPPQPQIDETLNQKINLNGGTIAIGHPVGASGNRILVDLIHHLKNIHLRYRVAALCIGITVLVETHLVIANAIQGNRIRPTVKAVLFKIILHEFFGWEIKAMSNNVLNARFILFFDKGKDKIDAP